MKYMHKKFKKLYEELRRRMLSEEEPDFLKACVEDSLKSLKISLPTEFGKEMSFVLANVNVTPRFFQEITEQDSIKIKIDYITDIVLEFTKSEIKEFFDKIIEFSGLEDEPVEEMHKLREFKEAFNDYMITRYGKSIEPQVKKVRDLVDQCFHEFAQSYLLDYGPGVLKYKFDSGSTILKVYLYNLNYAEIRLKIEIDYKIISLETV